MLTIIFAVAAMGIFVVFMSLGLLIRGKEIKGTCASKNAALFGEDAVCGFCGQTAGSCDTENSKENPKTTAAS
ncbi:MAG: hypothetical protein MUE85_22935 [Microscillaceae bacterium]|nr:hypothetical protein [Microscillaceae bacterium]